MASIRFMNQSGPFWDWINAELGPGQQQPFVPGGQPQGFGGPWSTAGPHHAGPPNRGHPFGHPHGHHGGRPFPPPPGPPPYPGHGHGHGHHGHHGAAPRDAPAADSDGETISGDEKIPTPSTSSQAESSSSKPQNKGKGPIGGHHQSGHPHGRRHCCGRARFGRPGARPWRCSQGAGGFPINLEPLQDIFGAAFEGNQRSNDNQSADFSPEADVFDTQDAYVIHISLPGAKKEDIAVHWQPEASELNVSGVVHRPGDEDLIKTLALDERKVGAFERAVKLGSRAYPAQIDPDAISAKLEEGILRVVVPKLDQDYVEIKKVDIE